MSEREISVVYTNWRGETRRRVIEPDALRWGSTEWHPEPGWLLTARDAEKAEMRDFALADCNFAAPALLAERDAARAEAERLREAVGILSGAVLDATTACVRWADQSESGGWSTHQVEANRRLATDLTVRAGRARAALGEGEE